MDGQAILTIGGVVGVLCKFAYRGGLSGRWSTIFVLVATTLAVALWGYTNQNFVRETVFEYFAGWASILLTAAGTFHTIEEAPKTQMGQATGNVVRKMTGTGDGTTPPDPPTGD